MITVQIDSDIDINSITNKEILDKLDDFEKQFIKAEEITYNYGDISFTEYNKNSLTCMPPRIFRYKLIRVYDLFDK